jgi:hypothetical protein
VQPARSVQNTSKVGSKLEACPVCSRSSTSCSSSSSSSTAQQQTQPAHLQLSAAPSALLPPSQSRVRRKPNPYHASEPTAWSSPRHDWYRVSHNLHEQHAAGPAHAPAAPIIACALAKNTPYHTSHRPPTRARLIRRRPRHLRDIHWPPARCTSPATAPLRRPLFAPTSVGNLLGETEKKPRRERCTNHYRQSRDTHLPVRPRFPLPTHLRA